MRFELQGGVWRTTMVSIDVPEVPYGPKLRQWNDQFHLGIVDGIYAVLADQRREAEVDENTRAIVRAADTKTKDYIKRTLGDVKEKEAKPSEVKDLNAYVAGRVASEMVEVGTGKKPEQRGYYLGERSAQEGSD